MENAAKEQRNDVFAYLLPLVQEVNCRNVFGDSALTWSIANKNWSMFKALSAHKNTKPTAHELAVVRALKHKTDWKIMNLLLSEEKASPESVLQKIDDRIEFQQMENWLLQKQY